MALSTIFQLCREGAVSFIGGGNRRTQSKPRPFSSHANWQTLSHNIVLTTSVV